MNKIPFRGQPVDQTTGFPIKPADLPTTLRSQAFDKQIDTAKSAKVIVVHCQQQGDWFPFSNQQLQNIQNQIGRWEGVFLFNRLVEPGMKITGKGLESWGGGWVVKVNENFRVTEEFILRYYLNQPICLADPAGRAKAAGILQQLV